MPFGFANAPAEFHKKIRTESTSLYPIRIKKEKEGEKRAFNHNSTDDVVRLKTK
jgi:hypothetical protein